jgi:hypothetical protein
MIPVTRDELISEIAFAIGTNLRLLPRKGEHLAIDAPRVLSAAVVRHLEMSRCAVFRAPPDPWHSTTSGFKGQ